MKNTENMIKKILIDKKTGQNYFVKDLDEDFHTAKGAVTKEELKNGKSNGFAIIDPSFADLKKAFQKGPQLIIDKDVGMIMAKTGIGRESKIVDAGGGMGGLCLSLGNICKEITSYEINAEHFQILSKNLKLSGLKNVKLKQENIYEGISEKNVDVITLDLPEPWRVIEHAEKALKLGGFLVIYLPNLTQVSELIKTLSYNKSICILETLELMERKWKIEGKIMRPEFEMLGHTAFLTFCRKIR